jgi:hypothetical protein
MRNAEVKAPMDFASSLDGRYVDINTIEQKAN